MADKVRRRNGTLRGIGIPPLACASIWLYLYLVSYDDWKTADPNEDNERYAPEPCSDCGEQSCKCDPDLMVRVERAGVYRCVLASRAALPVRAGRVVEVRKATAADWMATPLGEYLAELDAIAASRSVYA
jgi:hypothetical protein